MPNNVVKPSPYAKSYHHSRVKHRQKLKKLVQVLLLLRSSTHTHKNLYRRYLRTQRQFASKGFSAGDLCTKRLLRPATNNFYTKEPYARKLFHRETFTTNVFAPVSGQTAEKMWQLSHFSFSSTVWGLCGYNFFVSSQLRSTNSQTSCVSEELWLVFNLLRRLAIGILG